MIHACGKCGAMFEPTQSQICASKWICIECRRKDEAAYRERRRAAGLPTGGGEKRYDPVKAKVYRARPDVKAREATRMREAVRDPELRKKHEARWQARRAIESGRIARLPCRDCGGEKSEAHHPDYNKPLDVVFLCAARHRAEHGRAAGRLP